MSDTVTQHKIAYIGWREIPQEGGKKPRKVPTCIDTGRNINHLDSVNWRTYAEVKASGYNIGIVLMPADPFFLIDLDNCHIDGKWSEGAKKIIALFVGAFVEVSFNGAGLHIMGSCDATLLGDRQHRFNKLDVDVEFYTDKRFIALGQGGKGDMAFDCTELIKTFVPKKAIDLTPVSAAHNYMAGPVEEYTGSPVDEVVIKTMMDRKKDTFTNAVSIRDLWECRVDKLRLAYPTTTPGEPYNHSAADVALMAHLAFYTGKDYERMKRIFEMSKLMRAKWASRPDYQKNTIEFAIRHCQNVYDIKIEYDELMSVRQQKTFFKGCVYVLEERKIMVPKGMMLKQDQFRVMYGGYSFIMQKDSAKPTYSAWDSFTENRMFNFPKVRRMRFLPGRPHGEISGDGVNVFYQHPIPTAKGDVEPFLTLLEKMLPQESDREILLGWMASMVQNPGTKFLWSPVLQGTKGNGKGFISECLIHAVGEEYSWNVKPEKIDGKFNSYLQNRLLINVTEMNMFAKRGMLDALKDYITEGRQEIEGKGIDAKMVTDYCANWFFATNEKNGVIKERDDRRFCVFFTNQQRVEDLTRDGMDGNYFINLWAWGKGGGFACVRNYLMNYQIVAERDPAKDCYRAPKSTTTDEAIEASLSDVSLFILDAVQAQEVGFKGGWISSYHVTKLLENAGGKGTTTRAITKAVEALGYIRHGRSTKAILSEGNMRPVLYSKPTCVKDYHYAQGYTKFMYKKPKGAP